MRIRFRITYTSVRVVITKRDFNNMLLDIRFLQNVQAQIFVKKLNLL